MIRFAHLFAAIDATTSTNAKVAAMVDYFSAASPDDGAWAVFFLTGRRVKRLISARTLGQWLTGATGLSDWLLAECQSLVGDAAETLTLLLDELAPAPSDNATLAQWVEERLLPLRALPPAVQQERVLAWLGGLTRWERFTLLKLLTGELRLGVSHSLVVRALAQTASLPEPTIATRLAGDWTPAGTWFTALISPEGSAADLSRPYPFCLASPLGEGLITPDAPDPLSGRLFELLGDGHDWQVEWKWDGIRAQVIARGGRVWIWSRGSELLTDRFPEIASAAASLPDGTVLDGELLAFSKGEPLPFAALQTRIGRQRGVERQRRDIPVVFMTFDLLEDGGDDIRERPLSARRARLEQIVTAAVAGQAAPRTAGSPGRPRPQELLLPFEDNDAEDAAGPEPLQVSPLLDLSGGWDAIIQQRGAARARNVEGVMLKRRASAYGTGRKRGEWWKWKIEPRSVDAVLIYAQPGSGQRASLLTDYTFAVWDNGTLVPFAKAYSGLTDAEIGELDRWLRRHTVERFGPVRHVEPVQVFEIGFEAIAVSPRHRAGIAVRFPRMLRWRRDKTAPEADTLEALRAMVPPASRPS